MFAQMWLFVHLRAKCLHKCGCFAHCGRNVCTNVVVCIFVVFGTFHGSTSAPGTVSEQIRYANDTN